VPKPSIGIATPLPRSTEGISVMPQFSQSVRTRPWEGGCNCVIILRASCSPSHEGGGEMTAIPAPGAATRTGTQGSRLGLALVVIASAQLMVVLDATIVNVALPHIQQALGFSGSGLEWVVNAYAVTFGGLLLLGGRAGDRLGRRRVFTAGLLLFSAASF